MDPISALIGAGSSLIGGLMNSSSQSAINAANLKQNQAQFDASMQFAKDQAQGNNLGAFMLNQKTAALNAGINPLAALGVSNNVSAPMAVGANAQSGNPGEGLMQAGKILAQMKLPGADAPSKLDQLQAQLIESQIRRSDAETIGQQIRNSHLAVATQPGVKAGSDPAHAIPAFSWFTDKEGRPFLGQSREFADTQFGPGSWAPGFIAGGKVIGENVLQVGKGIGDDISHLYQSVRPDFVRFFSQTSGQ